MEVLVMSIEHLKAFRTLADLEHLRGADRRPKLASFGEGYAAIAKQFARLEGELFAEDVVPTIVLTQLAQLAATCERFACQAVLPACAQGRPPVEPVTRSAEAVEAVA
jgi:hypothetical protein